MALQWSERTTPSEGGYAELLVARRMNLGEASLVWLTRVPTDKVNPDEHRPFFLEDRQMEAVVISKYLGRYNLIEATD